jgi:hypothetical protein
MTKLEKEGYAIERVTAPSVIEKLKELSSALEFEFANNVNKKITKYSSTLFEADKSKKELLFKGVADIFKEQLQSVLPGYKPLMINYWTKKPGDFAVEIHQNWSHVDESKYRSYSIWIPLQDTDRVNGTMYVIPYSHRLFNKVRALNSRSYLFRQMPKSLVQKMLVEVKLKKGEYIIIDDAILHYTSPNNSSADREAVQLVVIPQNAQGKFYNCGSNNGMIDEYNADETFYRDLNISSAGSSVPSYAVKYREIAEPKEQATGSAFKLLFNRIFRYHNSVEQLGQ